MTGISHQPHDKESVEGLSFRTRRESSALMPELSVNSFPEGSLIPDYREPELPLSHGKKYEASMKNLIPVRFSSGSNPMDDAGFFSFSSFTWMTPMMWKLYRNHLDKDSLSLSPHDGAHANGER
ncbi:ATP-binding cassette sub-family C member 12 isoform X1 [Tachysurus ichikawai]